MSLRKNDIVYLKPYNAILPRIKHGDFSPYQDEYDNYFKNDSTIQITNILGTKYEFFESRSFDGCQMTLNIEHVDFNRVIPYNRTPLPTTGSLEWDRIIYRR